MGSKEMYLFGKIGNERGSAAEDAVARAVSACTESGSVPEWLQGYEKASRRDDKRGIDGWFHTDVGKIPVQIKSSRSGEQKAIERRPSIPTVVVQAGQSDEQIVGRCMSAIAPKRKEYLEKRKWY